MDEHVHQGITTELRKVDVLTVQEDGDTSFPDPIIIDRATELFRVMFSQDQDFLVEAKLRQTAGINFTGVIYARQYHVYIGDCIRDLELIAKACNPEDCANFVQYLPLLSIIW